ncbi:MAG: histidine phosphatase family protein [Chloroflexota bacterium]
MSIVYLVRHPHTMVNLSIPSSEWTLSTAGLEEAEKLALQPFWKQVNHIYTSEEPKSQTTARIVAAHTGVAWESVPGLQELDRSSYQPPDIAAYRSAVARIFSTPGMSVRGWETGRAAEDRILNAVAELERDANGTYAIVSHGLVLTLLIARIAGLAEPYAFWKSIGFAAVARLDLEKRFLVTNFDNSYLSSPHLHESNGK